MCSLHLDFASTPTVFHPAGCPTMVAGGSKNGNLYLFRTADLSVSGQPLQILNLNAPNDSLGSGGVGGVPAYDAPDNMLFITDAGPGVAGVSAGIVGLIVTASCTLQVAWSKPLSGSDFPNSTPTVANGVVYVGEGNTGKIHAFNTLTGVELWKSGTGYGAASTFGAPTVAGGHVYAGSWTSYTRGGIVGSFGLPTSTPILSVSSRPSPLAARPAVPIQLRKTSASPIPVTAPSPLPSPVTAPGLQRRLPAARRRRPFRSMCPILDWPSDLYRSHHSHRYGRPEFSGHHHCHSQTHGCGLRTGHRCQRLQGQHHRSDFNRIADVLHHICQ